MELIKTAIEGVYILQPAVHGDNRGWFMESYREDVLQNVGINTNFVQDNQSFTAKKGTVRGLHFQTYPHAQSKLFRVLRGKVLDVAVDLRPDSKTYKKYVAVELSEENRRQLYIPRGFAHGFVTLCDNVEVAYKVDEYYNKACDSGIRYDDEQIGVDWGLQGEPILSQKDKDLPYLQNSKHNFGTRVLVSGVKGQLGHDVVKLLRNCSIECVGIDLADVDITKSEQVRQFLQAYKPNVVVHCAAYTAVDRAEDEPEICRAVNAQGTKNLAQAAKELDAKFVYISTDYVYGGEGDKPFSEDAQTNPLNVYGKTKLEGEQVVQSLIKKHFILRTSWVFGGNGNNFVKTMLRLAGEKDELRIVNDQIGSPTYTVDLARLIVDMIFTDKYGIYNVTNEGVCSWCEFAKEIFEQSKKSVNVLPVSSSEYKVRAKRPLNSRLSKDKLVLNGFEPLPSWQDALSRFLKIN